MSITTRTLACGMPLLMEPMSGVRSAGITWLLPAGTAADPENRQGLGTLWSELLLRGAGDLSSRQQADAFDILGVSRGADVSTLHMRVSATLLGSRILEALPLIVEMVRRPRLEEEAIEASRDLALQSLDGLKDDPQERAVLTLRERHNPPPLNRSGLGTVEGLTGATREDLAGYWAERARPRGSIVAIAGDLESAGGPDLITKRLDALLHGWAGEAAPVVAAPSPTRGTYHHLADKSSQVQIVLMHDAPAEPSPDSKLERFVASTLSGGMGARLFTEVREKRGLCYSVSESYAADRDYGRCLAYVGTTPERAQESLDVLVGELRRVSTPAGRVTPEEFQRAMVGIRSSLVFSGESTGARASGLAGDMHRLGRGRTLDEIEAQYAAITLDQVNDYLARREMGPVTIVTLGPGELRPPE
ncbi:MAG TPA: pitrilysin family protein [Phycisphaerales bacterium]|mgnify:CR=1 FL=1|nr:pitrilysin family protein [Phycisphaerales bacterium]